METAPGTDLSSLEFDLGRDANLLMKGLFAYIVNFPHVFGARYHLMTRLEGHGKGSSGFIGFRSVEFTKEMGGGEGGEGEGKLALSPLFCPTLALTESEKLFTKKIFMARFG